MKGEEKRLKELFAALDPAQRQMLLEFAEFLFSRSAGTGELPEPRPIARPAEESVVRAIRRLTETYHMLDRAKLLHETAHYMTQHVLHGRPAAEVIEELEEMFEKHYAKLKAEGKAPKERAQ